MKIKYCIKNKIVEPTGLINDAILMSLSHQVLRHYIEI